MKRVTITHASFRRGPATPSAFLEHIPEANRVKNKLGAQSHDQLDQREVDFVRARQNEHSFNPRIPRTFDAAHLKALHRQLFQDVYEWAGHTRDEHVSLSDGTIATEPLRLSRVRGSRPRRLTSCVPN
jgi:fido (protein-threonine AMPylation protein)